LILRSAKQPEARGIWILNRVEDDGWEALQGCEASITPTYVTRQIRAPSKTFTTFTQSEHYLETSSYPTPIGHPGERSEYL
jgi:hypothetical protein